MSDPNLPDELRAEFKAIFPGLLDAFAEPRKGIITAYFCRHIRVAAALTDIGHAAGARRGRARGDAQGPAAGEHPSCSKRRRAEDAEDCARDRAGTCRLAPPRGTPFDPAPASSSAIHIEPTFGDPADWKAKELALPLPPPALQGARVPHAAAAQDLHADDLRRDHDAARHARPRQLDHVVGGPDGVRDTRPRSRRSSASSRRRRRTTASRPSARRSSSTCSGC